MTNGPQRFNIPRRGKDAACHASRNSKRGAAAHPHHVRNPPPRRRGAPNTQAVFRRVALEGESAAAVAREFKMKPNAVYQTRNRILRAVRDELDRFGRGRLSASDLLSKLEEADLQV